MKITINNVIGSMPEPARTKKKPLEQCLQEAVDTLDHCDYKEDRECAWKLIKKVTTILHTKPTLTERDKQLLTIIRPAISKWGFMENLPLNP